MTAPVSILIVDDEVRNLDVLEAILHASDYKLVRASSGNEALLLLVHGDFAVIVLDIHMPGMSGIELANLIKQRKRTQHIPILFLTAYYQDEKNVLEGYEVGAVDYLTKPVNPQILRSKVGVFVDLYRKTHALAAINRALEVEVGQRQQAEEALRQANVELETRVEQRTRDLTQANAALRASKARLQASEAHLRLVTDHASIYIAHVDRAHRYMFVNRAYAERYNLDRDQILGAHVADIVGERGYETFRHHLDEALTGKRVEFEIEVPYAKLGNRWIHVVYEPERTATGEVSGLVAVISDITARKQAELEVARARDEEMAASRAKDDFLAALSHELRTPLNPVLLLASEAVHNTTLPEEVRADFDVILKNTTLEARLIDDLLDLTRITHGKLQLEQRVVNLHALLKDALSMVESDIKDKHIALTLALADEAPSIMGDTVRLQQIFWNVLKNAVKFSGERGQIRVASEVDENVARVKISDSGIGMTPAELEVAFSPFVQGEHVHRADMAKFGGLGLGLAITRKLVEMHEGAIHAESAGRGQGALFTIEFPLADTADREPFAVPVETEMASIQTMAQASDYRSNGAPLRVLVVDDHAPTLAILKHLLVRRHFNVVAAATVAEARSLADLHQLDLFISDIGLPDGSGCTLMAEFRQKRPDLRGIALSGYGMETDLAHSRAAGFAAHLTKPVSVSALDRAISKVLA